MKVTRHLCDLCGGLIPVDEAFAVLNIPKQPSRAEIDADVRRRPELMFQRFFEPTAPSIEIQSYDVCRGCVTGLVRAREFMREQRTAFEQNLRSDCAPR